MPPLGPEGKSAGVQAVCNREVTDSSRPSSACSPCVCVHGQGGLDREISAAYEPASWGRAGAPARAARAPLEAGSEALPEIDVGKSGIPTAQQ